MTLYGKSPGRGSAIRFVLVGAALCLWHSLALAQVVGHAGMSPGPPGGYADRDYRVSLTWLEAPAPRGVALAPGNYARTLTVQGRQRYYEFHVPPGLAAGAPVPVVLVLHGGGGFPGTVRYESGMDETSDAHGFIALYPAGTGSEGMDRKLYWNWGPVRQDPALREIDDVAFMRQVLDDLARFVPVSTREVYATGISNGAQMCFRLAAELSDRIAAIAPVSGEGPVDLLVRRPPRPVPILLFHGQADRWLGFQGGHIPRSSPYESVALPPVPETVQGWVQQNHAATVPGEPLHIGHATRYAYAAPGTAGGDVQFWVLADGGHTWPGGRTTRIEELLGVGAINQDIVASTLIWEFFQHHPLLRAP